MFGAILSGLGSLFGASTATVGGALAASVGSTLISGLAGKGSQSQITQNVVDYEDMRKRAEAAGFNPLTALQNGGSAGFTRSTTTVPGLSSSQILKNAAAEGVKTWFNRDQIMRDQERDKLELALMRKELESMNQTSAVVRDKDFGYSIPHAVQRAGGDHVQVAAPALASAGSAASSQVGSHAAGPLPAGVKRGEGYQLRVPVQMPDGSVRNLVNPDAPDLDQELLALGYEAWDRFQDAREKRARAEKAGRPRSRPVSGPLYNPDQPALSPAPLPKRARSAWYSHPMFSGF